MQNEYPYQNISLSDIEGEIWLPIKGYEDYYMVSNFGRVKWLSRWIYCIDGRKRFSPEKIMKQYVHFSQSRNSKTLFVHLNVEKVRCRIVVSRLVYSTFIKPLDLTKDECFFILHRNLDTFLNIPENLYLASGKDLALRNIKAGYNKVMINNPDVREELTKRKRKPVAQHSLTGEFIRSYPSIREAKRKTGIDDKSIINTAKGKYNHAGGFLWKYIVPLEDN